MTLNLAHRGARRVAPENTLPAFKRAMEMGADGTELDVQISADGHLFVFHDIMLDKMTDGRGEAASLPLAALKELDAGAHFDDAWRGTPIPTLDEVFDTLPDEAFVNIELKRDTFSGDGATANRLEEATVEFIRRRNLASRVIVSSFNPIILWRLRKEAFPLGLLYAPDMPNWLTYGQSRCFLRLDALHPYYPQVRAPLPSLPINTWTVNEPAQMRRLLDLNINAIITDLPDLLADVMRKT
ncbi:MAG: glycerophosphodiester phosphodiesterase [Ardenticatenaceae bacterium]